MGKIFVSLANVQDIGIKKEINTVFGKAFELKFSDSTLPNLEQTSCAEYASVVASSLDESIGTIVLLNELSANCTSLDLEIFKSLERQNGMLAIQAPGISPYKSTIPKRLADNFPSGSGYSMWHKFPESEELAERLIRVACGADRKRIRNSRPLTMYPR